jgi:uncharacterized membrane protein
MKKKPPKAAKAKNDNRPRRLFGPPDPNDGTTFWGHVRNYLLTGLLVLAPTAVTLWVFYRLLNFVDNILGRYLRFSFFDYHRIPGIGLVATLVLLILVGWMASWIGARPAGRLWDRLLSRIPGVGILYGSTKSLGEAFFSKEPRVFQKVVLVPWPSPGMWRIGFITGRASSEVTNRLPADVEVVYIPHTPNPASGFVHYVPKSEIIFLDWPIEDGLRVIISGGVVQPGAPGEPVTVVAGAATVTRTVVKASARTAE